jgi:iron uptake system component EfeO
MKKVISVALLSMLVLAGCSDAADSNNKKSGDVSISFDTKKGCTPKTSYATAGTFAVHVHNSGNEAGELEILDGDRVKGEVENILPNTDKSFTVKLSQGTYEIMCGNKQSPKGKIKVTGTATKDSNNKVSKADLSKATDAYKKYVVEQSEALKTSVRTLTDPIRQGNLAAAQAAYGASRIPYERIEPIAELFASFDARMDARVDDFSGVDDPEFTGFHKIEYVLFEKNTTDGLTAIADQLDKDSDDLAAKIRVLTIDPLDMAKGPQALVEEVANGKITGEEDRYAGTDLYDFRANIDGSVEIVNDLRFILKDVAPDFLTEVDKYVKNVDTRLNTYQNADGTWKPYSELTKTDRTKLKADIAALSELLSSLPGTLGLS